MRGNGGGPALSPAKKEDGRSIYLTSKTIRGSAWTRWWFLLWWREWTRIPNPDEWRGGGAEFSPRDFSIPFSFEIEDMVWRVVLYGGVARSFGKYWDENSKVFENLGEINSIRWSLVPVSIYFLLAFAVKS